MLKSISKNKIKEILSEIPENLRKRFRMPPTLEALDNIGQGEDIICCQIIFAWDQEYNEGFREGINWKQDCYNWLHMNDDEINLIYDLMCRHGWNPDMVCFG